MESEVISQITKKMIDSGYDKETIGKALRDADTELKTCLTVRDAYRLLMTYIAESPAYEHLMLDRDKWDYEFNQIDSVDSILSYKDFVSKCTSNVVDELKKSGYENDIIHEALSGKDVYTVDDAARLCDKLIENKVEMNKRVEQQRQIAISKDYVDDVAGYLHSRNVTVVHPRELADTYLSLLTKTEKEKYGNNPTYAVSDNIEDVRLQKALAMCVEKFNHSKMVDKVIDDYIAKNYPDEENRNMVIDKLSALCPDLVKCDDARANAYQTIINLSVSENKEEVKKDAGVFKRAAAAFSARFLSGEPMRVAEDTCAPDRQTQQEVNNELHKDTTTTTEESITKRQEADPEWAIELKKQMEEYKKTIQSLQKQVDRHKGIERDRQYPREDYRYTRDDYRYRRDDYRQPRDRMGIPTWLIGVGVNIILMIMVFLVGMIAKVSFALAQIGLLISAIGYPMVGRHKDAKRFLIIGYGMFIVWLVWSVLL